MAIINVTLNPSDMTTGTVLSNGNLTVSQTSIVGFVRATHGKTSGKWYWEVKLDSGFSSPSIGISNLSFSINSTISPNTDINWRAFRGSGLKLPESIAYGTSSAIGDILGVALDLDNGTLEFYKNGVSMGVSHTDVKSLGEVYPTIGSNNSNSRTLTVNFGASSFAYSIPHGFFSYDGSQYGGVNKFLILSNDGKVKSLQNNESIYTTNMTASTSPSPYVVTSSGTGGTGYENWRAFDGLSDKFWRNGTNIRTGWIGIDFGESKKVNTLYLTSPHISNTIEAMAKDFSVQGSNDGTNFTTIKEFSIQSWGVSETKELLLDKDVDYRYYRIDVTLTYRLSDGSEKNGTLAIGEILYAYIEKPKVVNIPYSEQNFIKYGMDKSTEIDLQAEMTNKVFVEQSSTPLGSGKVFKKTIDTSTTPIKKVEVK